MAGMVKALTSAPSFSALIKDPAGDAPVTHEESHGNLLNHHFPAHTDAPPPPEEQQQEGETDWDDPVMALLTPPPLSQMQYTHSAPKKPLDRMGSAPKCCKT